MNPGSEEAIKAGCICPVMDNRHGKGAYVDSNGNAVFWYNLDCPIHKDAIHIKMDTLLFENKSD